MNTTLSYQRQQYLKTSWEETNESTCLLSIVKKPILMEKIYLHCEKKNIMTKRWQQWLQIIIGI